MRRRGFNRGRREFRRRHGLGGRRGFIGRRRVQQGLFKQAVENFIRADHAHIGARPLLNRHQSALQVLDFGRQRAVFLSLVGVFLGLRPNADAQGLRLAHAVFVKPEQIMQKDQYGDQHYRQQLQFQAVLGGIDHGARGGSNKLAPSHRAVLVGTGRRKGAVGVKTTGPDSGSPSGFQLQPGKTLNAFLPG